MTYLGSEFCYRVKCSARSSPWPRQAFGEWTSHSQLVMTGSVLPVACGPLRCLFGEWCSAVKCWPSWQQFRCPLGPMAGACLAHTSQADWHPGGCGGRGGGGGGWVWTDRGEELLAEHPGGRPGLLPAGEKTSLLKTGPSRLCGDWDLSLHFKSQHYPIVICLGWNSFAHKTPLLLLKTFFFWHQTNFLGGLCSLINTGNIVYTRLLCVAFRIICFAGDKSRKLNN